MNTIVKNLILSGEETSIKLGIILGKVKERDLRYNEPLSTIHIFGSTRNRASCFTKNGGRTYLENFTLHE